MAKPKSLTIEALSQLGSERLAALLLDAAAHDAALARAENRRDMIDDDREPDDELSESDVISPWYIGKRLGMSQQELADTLGIPVATLRNWERNRVAMEPATIALMRILARELEAALRALHRRAA